MTPDLPEPDLREPAHRVSPRARTMWLTESAVQNAAVAVAAWAANHWWVHLPWWVVALVVLALLAELVVVPQWRFLVHRWEVTETAVYTQTGWWVRERRIAPMSRLQTVDHVEGAVERLFGLASVTVTTASAAGALRISGLDRAVARRLVDDLTVRADAVEGDAT